MFRFGFADPAAPPHDEPPAEGGGDSSAQPATQQEAAEEVLASEGVPTGAQEIIAVSPTLSLIKGVVSNSQAAALLSDDRVASNDVIAGVYEGGFKTWEGGVDLAQYVAMVAEQQQAAAQQAQRAQRAVDQAAAQQEQEEPRGQAPPLALGPGSRVMELGCGSGLPGLVALWAGAEAHFQDYNRSVLTRLTTQNVAANAAAWAARQAAGSGSSGAADAAARARYFAGSWDALPGLLAALGLQHSYDLVLTAETIYSLEAMRSLLAAIKACLRPGSGVALVAAKSYYFGVGGGTAAFARLVARDGVLECSCEAVLDDGQSNKREILRLSFPAAAAAAEAAEDVR